MDKKAILDKYETLWETLYYLRESEKRTIRGAAAILAVTPSWLSDVEHGRIRPNDKQLDQLARLYRIRFADLKNRNGPNKQQRAFLKAHPELVELLKKRANGCDCQNCFVLD